MGSTYEVDFPFKLVPCHPVSYFKLGPTDKLLLWINPKTSISQGIARFVTALGLLNFNIAWLSQMIGVSLDIESPLGQLVAILEWKGPLKLQKPSCSLSEVLKDAIHQWNIHTGDGVSVAIPFERLNRIMQSNLTRP